MQNFIQTLMTYFTPGKSNAYFASAGVFNTGGKLVESLYLNGVKGNPNGIR